MDLSPECSVLTITFGGETDLERLTFRLLRDPRLRLRESDLELELREELEYLRLRREDCLRRDPEEYELLLEQLLELDE